MQVKTTSNSPVRVEQLANPELYRRLAAYFGRENVTVLRPGVRSQWRRLFSVNGVEGSRKSFRDSFERGEKGEEFRLNCPFCGDSRQRLFINHQWALWNETTRSRHKFLAYCHNSDCLREEFRQQKLYSFLFERPLIGVARQTDDVKVVRLPDKFDGRLPGTVLPLEQASPTVPARRFLIDRGFDPSEIARDWDVGLCTSGSVKYSGRLYIPIHSEGNLAGWMCRYPGDRVGSQTLKEAGVRKYLFAPGMATSRLLYNLDAAREHPVLVIVEGATDAWRVGLNAVAVFGKRIHDAQCELLARAISKGRIRYVVLMLDPDQSAEEIRRGAVHHITSAERILRPWVGRTPLVTVRLHPGTDPGGSSRSLLARQMTAAGVPAALAGPING